MPEDLVVERILVVMAHPDDVDFSAAGSVAVWTEQDVEVTYCIVTDGEAGGSDRSISRREMAAIRRSEQTAAAECVGVTDVRFLGFADGRVEATLDLRRDISRVIRQVQPQRVVCQNSQRNFDFMYGSHPDHLAAAEAALCAVYPDARNPFAHAELLDEGLEPWSVGEVYLLGGPNPNVVIDTSAVIDRKIKALLCHASQISDPEAMETMLRQRAATTAARFELPDGSSAEAFQRLETR